VYTGETKHCADCGGGNERYPTTEAERESRRECASRQHACGYDLKKRPANRERSNESKRETAEKT
jgi:hypothetical protein